MSRKALFAKKGRRVAVLGAAGLGAGLVLAACSPVQLGAAAVVGNQRITTSALDTQVASLQTAAKPYGSAIQLTTANMPAAVLSWLIRFQIMDQVAAAKGITVTAAQAQAGLASLASVAKQNGASSTTELLVHVGVAPPMFPLIGQWEAQQDAFAKLGNNGQEPTSTAQQTAFTTAINKAQCSAAQNLNIQVSPQYGRFDYATTSFGVVAAPYTLSKPDPDTSPSPASTEGLTPAAC
ncbi:MAG TPA: SurA N-terminal domain-containing protein [Trebonia sp.]